MYTVFTVTCKECVDFAITSQHDTMTTEEPKSKFLQDVTALLPTITSGKCHIKWKRLVDLPVDIHNAIDSRDFFGAYSALYIIYDNAYNAVQDRKFYISGGGSPVKYAQHQV